MRYSLFLSFLLVAPTVAAQTFDPRPTAGSLAASGAVFTNARVSNSFFAPTTYRGAFAPGGDRWDLPWANYTPRLTDYGSSTTGVTVLTGSLPTQTLRTGTRYRLQGFVRVLNGSVLTIEPGVVIFGERSSTGTLVIERGGQIIAEGTASNPIVFTSEFAPGARNNGDWGGIIIAGRAAINAGNGEAVIEGGTGTIYGGGAVPNDNDTSGLMRYVRIEFAGIAFQPNNEINSLTLGGVGRGTTLEYIQCSYGGDDAFEWFGGTVNGRYLIATATVDDMFDGDNGWTGNVQFGLGISDPDIADVSQSNGFEQDNDAGSTGSTPLTAPTLSNISVFGPRTQRPTGNINANFRRAAHLRRNARTSLFNSVLVGFPLGIVLDGSGSVNASSSGALVIQGTLVSGGVTDANTSVAGDTGVALAYFNSQPGNALVASAAAAGFGSITVAAEPGSISEAGFTLGVQPNPAVSGRATLSVEIPEATAARLSVFDVLGREVAVVADETMAAGARTFALGRDLPAGVYVARLQTARGAAALQFTVVR